MIIVNKARSFFIGLLVITSFLFINPSVSHAACITGDFAGGSGTEPDPWQIATPTQLANVGTCIGVSHSDKYFVLTDNIDLDVSPYNTGTGWTPIGTSGNYFYGKFDGNNYTISNLFINSTSSVRGLFGYTQSSVIENLVLANVNITSTQTYTGGLVGYSTTSSVITNVSVSGTVSTSSSNVGGLTGYANLTTISDSSSSVTVSGTSSTGGLVGYMQGSNNDNATITNSYATGNVRGSSNVGGLIGFKYYGTVTDSYATGDILGDKDGGFTNSQSGGFVGTPCLGVITESYATGDVYGDSDVGGFAGQSHNCGGTISNSYSLGNVYPSVSGTGGSFMRYIYLGTVTNSYAIGSVDGQTNGGFIYYDHTCTSCTDNFWDTETSGQSTGGIFSGGRATGKTTLQMKDQPTYTNWDFDTVWDINLAVNDGYPFLRWQEFSPVVQTLLPASDAVDVAVDANLVMTFDKASGADSGNITIYDVSDDSVHEVIDVAGGQITGNGTITLTIDPVNDFEEGATYYIFIDATAIRANDGAYFAGIDDDAVWRFTTEDVTPPSLVTLSPADDATGVVFNPTLEMTFDEPVVFDNGTITVYQASDDTEIVSIPVAGGIADTTVSVSFLELLEPSTEYYVLVSATAIADETGNNFAGISDATAWSFTTRAVNDPILTYPTDNSAAQSSLEIEYEIFEAPLANSIQLIFAGDETVTITLADVGVGEHNFTLDVANIASSIAVASSTANTIPEGVYNVTLRHKDLLNVATLSTTSTSVTIDTTAPILTVVSSPSSTSTIAQARLYFTTDESCTPLAEAPISSTGPVESIISETLVGITNYATISGMQVGGVYSFSFLCRDNSNNSSDLLTFGPVTIIPEQSVRRSSGGQASPAMLAQLGIQTQSKETNNQAQIQKLLAQVQELQKVLEQLQQEQGGSESVTIPDDICLVNLWKQGMRGECIGRVQIKLGVIPVSGYFGPRTLSAVRKFQTENNLDVDGVVGSQTWDALFKN